MGRMQKDIQKLESRIAEMKHDMDRRFKTYEQTIKHEHTKLNHLLSQHNATLNNTRNEYNLLFAQKESKRMCIYEERNVEKPMNYIGTGKSDSTRTLVEEEDEFNTKDNDKQDQPEMKREKSFESLKVERMIANDVRRNVLLRELRIINE